MKQPTEKFLAFFYGTLMRDGCRNHVLRHQKFIREAKTTKEYALLDLGAYPGLVRVEDGRSIEGELWEVEPSLIPVLDKIEGSPHMYRLENVEIEGEENPVFTYFFKLRTKTTKLYNKARWNNE